MPSQATMAALQQSILSLGVIALTILLLQAIYLSYPPNRDYHNPEQLTIILHRIHKLSSVVEEIYETSYQKPLTLNNLEVPRDSRPDLDKVLRFIITYLLVVALACGLYFFVGGVDSIRSRVLKVQLLGYALLTANLGLVGMLLFFSTEGVAPAPFWGYCFRKPRDFVCRFDLCEARPITQSLGALGSISQREIRGYSEGLPLLPEHRRPKYYLLCNIIEIEAGFL